MTSGNFTEIAVDSITVDRETRQRKELKDVPVLAQSIASVGLINPIVITREHTLVAGERRLEAHKHLGIELIPAQFTDELDPETLHLIELEENIKRVDLSWQDEVNAVAAYDALRRSTEESWSAAKTAEAIGYSETAVKRRLLVKSAMDEGVPEVVEASALSVAANFASRRRERMQSSAIQSIPTISVVTSDEPEIAKVFEAKPAPKRNVELLHSNFHQWAKTPQKVPFNLIHCDFPYGVTAGDKQGQSGAKVLGGYEDSSDIYFELIETLGENSENFIAKSAHMIFWYSMKYHDETVRRLKSYGWNILDFPLIWHKSDNKGILSDPQRRPRHTYETALFCSRGDRLLVKPKADSFSAPTSLNFHMSEKPSRVLEHFLSMLVDESTVLLDPTCGSGNAILVGEELGANYCLGIEKEEEYYARACNNLNLDP